MAYIASLAFAKGYRGRSHVSRSITGELHALPSATMLVGCNVSPLAIATIPEDCSAHPHQCLGQLWTEHPWSEEAREILEESGKTDFCECRVKIEVQVPLASCMSSQVPPGRRTGRYIVGLTVTLAAGQAERADMA